MKFLWLKNIAYLYFVIAGCIVVEVKENSFYFKQPSLFFILNFHEQLHVFHQGNSLFYEHE